MKFISTKNALKPGGHYSQAIAHDNLLFISGQLSIDPNTGEKKFGSIEEETLQTLENMELILKEAGTCKEKVLKVTLYIPDIQLWDRVNKVYKEFFGDHKPARSVVPTKDLHYGFKIEIEAIAAIN
ncbi:RidA family protein [uncultured Clostridium sp.]|uniref:RidA family protein n=1 Tax=uncultured Clostridium sp. TaxID=59620 RepID=UPI0028E616AD|nr:RidA family protein [uncultured Clostridium sp.]